MRIVQVNSVYGRGSTGRIVQDLHRAVLEAGHEAYVATGRGAVAPATGVRRFGSPASTALHGLHSRLLDRHGLGSVKATRDLVSWLDELRPDVVHLHNLHGYYLNYPTLFGAALDRGTKLVWTLHDSWAYTGHCAYYDFAECERWRNGCGSCPQLRSYPASIVVDRSGRNLVDKARAVCGQDLVVVTPSRWLARDVSASLLGCFEQRVIPNDPDLRVFRPRMSAWRNNAGIAEDAFLVLAVASAWVPRKGLDHLFELAERLAPGERLVVVGHLPRGRELPSHVVHVPHTDSGDELAAIYSTADVFVNPTLEDNYPTTNLEALACGTPIITFDTGGSPEALDRGAGMVTQQRTGASLRVALDELRRQGVGHSRGSLLTRAGRGMVGEYLHLYAERASVT